MSSSLLPSELSVNALSERLAARLIDNAARLRITISRTPDGTVIADAGVDAMGGIEAGVLIARLCMGGLGRVAVRTSLDANPLWPSMIDVHTSSPVLACLGSQYAGWSLAHGEGKGGFHALGSGPGRAAAGREELFAELAYRDVAESVCIVLEVDKKPPIEIAEKVARDCGVKPDRVTLILTPTRSLAGSVQIVARVLEVALHKAHALGFPLHQLIDGAGSAPVPPPSADFLTAMGRTNDAILFGGYVQLFVDCEDGAAGRLAASLPASMSKDHGKPFAQVFKDAAYDFYRIDPHLFAPAAVAVTALKSGKTFHAGAIDAKLLEASFGSGNG
jgi:methenyltetrahydromethanopterin cyclohydrolase